MDSMKPGGGGRFKALEGKLSHRPGVTNPGALAAYIGRRKYGDKRMAHMASAGRKRHDAARKESKGGAERTGMRAYQDEDT